MKYLKTYELFGIKKKRNKHLEWKVSYPNEYKEYKVGDWIIVYEDEGRSYTDNEVVIIKKIRSYDEGLPLFDCFYPYKNFEQTFGYEDIVKKLSEEEIENYKMEKESEKYNL